MITNFLLIILVSLILFNVYKYVSRENIIETYENYGDDPLILAQKNAGNIEDLKSDLEDLKKSVDTMGTTLNDVKDQSDSNTASINGLLDGQKKSGEQINSKLNDISD